jgi:coatomer subunit beta'
MYSYELLQSVLQYQQAILEQDFDAADKLFSSIPSSAHLKLAKFLEVNEYKDYAYKITPDATHKLNLAIELGQLEDALELAKNSGKASSWKQVGDLALIKGYFDTAEQCFKEGKDLSSLFLLYTATSNREGLKNLQEIALTEGITNIAFLSNYLLVIY